MPDEPQIQSAGEPVHVQQQPAPQQVGQDVSAQPTASDPQPASTSTTGLPVLSTPKDQKPSDKVKLGRPKLPQKEKNPSTSMAIVATVIIVLGLAALAVLAYIKTKK